MARPLTRSFCRQRFLQHITKCIFPLHHHHHQPHTNHLSTSSYTAQPFLSPSPSSPSNPPSTTSTHKPLPTTTLAATYTTPGDPHHALSLSHSPLPQLQAGQLLLRYLAAPINPSDLNMVEGSYPVQPAALPAVAGNEGVAVIEAIGGSSGSGSGSGSGGRWAVGQWVNPIRAGMGTWREWAVVGETDVEIVPAGLTVQQAAVLSVNPCTAYRLLHDIVQLDPGAVVIQNAATSAVGQAVIQIAHQLRITTINLIRPRPTTHQTQHTIDQLHALGATHVLLEDDPAALHTALASLPPPALALNGIGGTSSTTLLKALGGSRKSSGGADGGGGGGVHVTYGGMSRRPVTAGTGQLIFGDVTLRGFWMSRWNEAHEGSDERRQMREVVAGWMREGKLRLDVEEVRLVDEGVDGIRDALKRNEEPFKMRKVLLSFASANSKT